MAEIYLAGGCFWGLEEYFSRISGVLSTSVGYANGQVETTNYQLLKETDHAETVQVIYDEKAVSLREILLYYFRVIDPLSINQQGNDRGRQYRTGIYYQDEATFEEGIYVDITTGEPLFFAKDKFASGCGWPSFSRPISKELIHYYKDLSHGMERIEVRSRSGNAHLGHVFTDGPQELGGLRYCINSASLRFIAKDEMEKAGYGYLLPYLNK